MSRSDLPWHRRLAFLIIGFLTISLLPIGLISVVQTDRLSREDRTATEATLLAVTERVALTERVSIEHAMGAATALTSLHQVFSADRATCETYLRDYVARAERYIFVGLVGTDGKTICSSSGRLPDFTQRTGFDRALSSPDASLVIQEGGQNKMPVITVFQPYFDAEVLSGFVAVSLPHPPFQMNDDLVSGRGFVGLASLAQGGTVLTYTGNSADFLSQLPPALSVAEIASGGKRGFYAKDAANEWRIYTIAPLVENSIYAVGIWRDDASLNGGIDAIPAAIMPIAMWITSLLVACFAMHRLVTRHVRGLSLRMRIFARHRQIDHSVRAAGMPAELAEISNEFDTMALDIVRDEAELEDALRSKDVLLKEVHHRVKNNLQLIASIMNIQLRTTKNPDTTVVVKNLQERVLGLATIHQNLYKLQAEGRVNAGSMVGEIVFNSKALVAGLPLPIEFSTELQDVLLYPDQAVPLSLLVTEVINAAIKFQTNFSQVISVLTVSLKLVSSGECELKIVNSAGGRQPLDEAGLGATLIKAFVTQMGGQLTQDPDPGINMVSVRFPVEEFSFDAGNY